MTEETVCRTFDAGGRATNNRAHSVLIVDDDRALATLLGQALSVAGFRVTHAFTVEQAVSELSRVRYGAALVDVGLPDGSGHLVLARAQALRDSPVVMMMSGRTDITTVVAALRDGAAEFLLKPIAGDDLVTRLERLLPSMFERASRKAAGVDSMRDTLRIVDKVAATSSSGALIVGESGSGKKALAARIHARSRRSEGSFLRVNIAAIPRGHFEAELFGSVKGPFTGANADRVGHLKSAEGGTIVLDGIGDLALDDQAKLLRVIDERTFFAVGSQDEHALDVRIIAATNLDPMRMLEDGRLRPDLFYRLGTVIRVPALRDRRDESASLALRFIEASCAEYRRPVCRLAPEALHLLEAHSWPGNIRQLRSAVERAVMLADSDVIQAEAFALLAGSDAVIEAGEPRPVRRRQRGAAAEQSERDEVARALATATSRTDAARALGISRSTLYEKIKRHNL